MADEFDIANRLIKPEEITKDRNVEPNSTTRDEAKRICKFNGVVWECE